MPRGKKSTLEKAQERLGEALCAELEALSADDLRKRMAGAEAVIIETESACEADQGVKERKNDYDNAIGPYKDAIAGARATQRVIAALLSQKGQL
jgi:hypothetical protein